MSIAACAEIVRRADPDRFLAVMAGPVETRRKLFPLFAMNVEISRAPWVTNEPLIAMMRLQWWHDALEEIAAQATVRSHEVVSELAEVLNPEQAQALVPVAEARKWDVETKAFDDLSHLNAHLGATSGVLTSVATEVCGGPPDVGRQIGFGIGAANWLIAVPALMARGLKPLPGDPSDAISALAAEALKTWPNPRSHRSSVPAACLPVFWTGMAARPVLERARRDPVSVLEGRVAISEFRKRLRLISMKLGNRW